MTIAGPGKGRPDEPRGGREGVAETFAALTDVLVSSRDVLDLAAVLVQQSVALLEVDDAAVLLCDTCTDTPTGPRGATVAAASSPRVSRLETFGVELVSGPGMDSVRTGRPVSVPDLNGESDRGRWPRFATAAADAGITAVHTLQLQAGNETLGALTLLHTVPHILDDHSRRLGQALADTATIGLLHLRAAREAETSGRDLRRAQAREERARYLAAALHSRDVIGQAKGILIAHYAITADEAFALLSRVSQHTNIKVQAIAAVVVDRVRALGPAPAQQCQTVTGVLDDLLAGR